MAKKVQSKKAQAKATTTKVTEKASVKAEPEKIETKKTEPGKIETKKTEPGKIETKKSEEKKIETKKSDLNKIETQKEVQKTLVVEYHGKQVEESTMFKAVEKDWTESGRKAEDIKKITLYVKPEEAAVYYVINDKETGSVEF